MLRERVPRACTRTGGLTQTYSSSMPLPRGYSDLDMQTPRHTPRYMQRRVSLGAPQARVCSDLFISKAWHPGGAQLIPVGWKSVADEDVLR